MPNRIAIQAYLTAAVINLKRLAAFADGFYSDISDYLAQILAISKIVFACERNLGNNGTGYCQLVKI